MLTARPLLWVGCQAERHVAQEVELLVHELLSPQLNDQ